MPFFKNKTANLYYEISGSGAPLLLINGLAGDTRQWQPLIEKLSGHFEIISYDMRCTGKSDKPDEPFTIDDLADEACTLTRHLGHDKISVLGFSMGGMVAMSFALKNPGMVERLFLAATAPSLRRPNPPSERAMKIFHSTEISPALLGDLYNSIFGSAYRKKTAEEDFVNFRLNDQNPQPTSAYLQQLNALESFDIYEDVGKISVPAVILAGEEDAVIPPQNARWLHENMVGSKLHTFKSTGHMLPLEIPNEMAGILISNK